MHCIFASIAAFPNLQFFFFILLLLRQGFIYKVNSYFTCFCFLLSLKLVCCVSGIFSPMLRFIRHIVMNVENIMGRSICHFYINTSSFLTCTTPLLFYILYLIGGYFRYLLPLSYCGSGWIS